jgi:hypothetical protein
MRALLRLVGGGTTPAPAATSWTMSCALTPFSTAARDPGSTSPHTAVEPMPRGRPAAITSAGPRSPIRPTPPAAGLTIGAHEHRLRP